MLLGEEAFRQTIARAPWFVYHSHVSAIIISIYVQFLHTICIYIYIYVSLSLSLSSIYIISLSLYLSLIDLYYLSISLSLSLSGKHSCLGGCPTRSLPLDTALWPYTWKLQGAKQPVSSICVSICILYLFTYGYLWIYLI